jgi:hypothetical protein
LTENGLSGAYCKRYIVANARSIRGNCDAVHIIGAITLLR